jgi:hypothetical protein
MAVKGINGDQTGTKNGGVYLYHNYLALATVLQGHLASQSIKTIFFTITIHDLASCAMLHVKSQVDTE